MKISEVVVEGKNKNRPAPAETAQSSVSTPTKLDLIIYDTFVASLVRYAGKDAGLKKLIAKKIAYIAELKASSPNAKSGGNDSPLDGKLAGYWHLHISRTPDIALIYKVDKQGLHVMSLASHDEYQKSNKVANLAQVLGHATRV